MNTKQFNKDIRKTFDRCIAIIEKKNHDYSGVSDPFGSFRHALIAHIPIPQSILLFVIQKISRLGNLMVRPAAVVQESMEDTILDAINYLAILLAYIHSQKK